MSFPWLSQLVLLLKVSLALKPFLTFFFQTPKDPSSRKDFCCHGHQANPADIAADFHFYSALGEMPTTSNVLCVHRCVITVTTSGLVNIQGVTCVKKILSMAHCADRGDQYDGGFIDQPGSVLC